MSHTVTQDRPVPTQADIDTLMAATVRSLARDGITPQHVLSWDKTGEDPCLRAVAAALGGYLGRSAALSGSTP